MFLGIFDWRLRVLVFVLDAWTEWSGCRAVTLASWRGFLSKLGLGVPGPFSKVLCYKTGAKSCQLSIWNFDNREIWVSRTDSKEQAA